MLKYVDISKHYPDGTVALDAVNLEIPKGQFCVILGPSGAGKSTLLRLLNGMTTASNGEVHFDGLTLGPTTLRQIQHRVAMIHQQFNLVDRLSVLNNILTGALPSVSMLSALFGHFPQDLHRRACQLLDQVELGEEHLYRRAMELSGGQQQRVAIARAFILKPDVVLADEPVASLDPKISQDILELLGRTSRQYGATVLCSLHQVDLARRFADRIIGMRQGKVVFDGPGDALDDNALTTIYGGDLRREAAP